MYEVRENQLQSNERQVRWIGLLAYECHAKVLYLGWKPIYAYLKSWRRCIITDHLIPRIYEDIMWKINTYYSLCWKKIRGRKIHIAIIYYVGKRCKPFEIYLLMHMGNPSHIGNNDNDNQVDSWIIVLP